MKEEETRLSSFIAKIMAKSNFIVFGVVLYFSTLVFFRSQI